MMNHWPTQTPLIRHSLLLYADLAINTTRQNGRTKDAAALKTIYGSRIYVLIIIMLARCLILYREALKLILYW